MEGANDAGASESPNPNPGACSNARLQRIADLMTASLSKDDPLEANMDVITCDLMLIGHRMQGALAEVDLDHAGPAVAQYLKIVGLIERLEKRRRNANQLRDRDSTSG